MRYRYDLFQFAFIQLVTIRKLKKKVIKKIVKQNIFIEILKYRYYFILLFIFILLFYIIIFYIIFTFAIIFR